jgi:Tfp pilus assembly protein PilF
MLFGLSAALLLILSASCVVAGTLKGRVLLNEEGGTPVRRVEISAVGANSTETEESGSFTLEFPNAQPGDVVVITVNKPGYVVVNYVQLRMILPKNPDSELLTLFLCKESEREEWTRQLYRLKSVAAIEQNYKELENANAQNEAALRKLQEQHDEALAAAVKAADQLAQPKPVDTSGLYNQAMSLFLDGRVPEALQVLSDQKLRESLDAAKKQKAEGDEGLRKSAENYLLKARLLNIEFDFPGAASNYELAIQAAPGSRDAHLAFAYFNEELHHYGAARVQYQQAIDIARNSGDLDGFAAALLDLGNVNIDENRLDEARRDDEEALKAYKFLALHNPATYTSYLASAEGNLGGLDLTQNRPVEARQNLESALAIFSKLEATNSKAHLPDLALAKLNLGMLDESEHRLDEAYQLFKEALQTYTLLAQQQPDIYLEDQAASLDRLGGLEELRRHLPEARQDYEHAVEIDRQLVAKSADRYIPGLAESLSNLENVDADQSHPEQESKHYEEARKYYTRLAQQDPDAYAPSLAALLNNLGGLNFDQNRPVEARQQYEQALEQFRQLAQKNPDEFQPRVADSLCNLGMLDKAENRMADAQGRYREALSIYKKLAERAPTLYANNVAKVQSYLDDLDRKRTNPTEKQ